MGSFDIVVCGMWCGGEVEQVRGERGWVWEKLEVTEDGIRNGSRGKDCRASGRRGGGRYGVSGRGGGLLGGGVELSWVELSVTETALVGNHFFCGQRQDDEGGVSCCTPRPALFL